jgi:phosphatidylserine decarboxylase
MKFFVKLFLSILSFRVFSRLYGRLVRLRRPGFLVKKAIARFREAYKIEMDDYQGEAEDYKSLADFFVRRLDPEKRPLIPDKNAVVSPADGKLTGMETIYIDQALQVKGKTYSISQLLKKDIDFSQGWHASTIYLSPNNYHRYHYPVSGTIKQYLHTGARLFPVNSMGVNHIDRLFVRNERIITEFETRDNMPFYMVAVGASFVGSIKMEFIKECKKRHQWIPLNTQVNQLEEMGRFEMGSTIVMVFPEKMAKPIPEVVGQPVRVGQPVCSVKC